MPIGGNQDIVVPADQREKYEWWRLINAGTERLHFITTPPDSTDQADDEQNVLLAGETFLIEFRPGESRVDLHSPGASLGSYYLNPVVR